MKRRKRTRRGKYSKKCSKYVNSKDKLSILHTNCQAVKNKISSLQAIVNSLNVDLVTVNETHLKGNDKLKLEGYTSFTRNRQNAEKGGIATSIVDKHAVNVLKVTEGKDDEYIITRHGDFEPAVNVINFYGKQESRQTISGIN